MASQVPNPLPSLLTAAEMVQAAQRVVADRTAVRDSCAREVTPETATFANVIQPWLEEEDLNQGIEAVIEMFRYAGSTKEIRDAAEEATSLLSKSFDQFALRRDLFVLVKAVSENDDMPNEECKTAVQDILQQFSNVGHGKLRPEEMEMLLDARNEISQLCQEFNRNLRETSESLEFSPEELDGIPKHEIERFQRAETGDNIIIDLGKGADRLLILRHAHNAIVRKKLYIKNEQKLHENTTLFKKVVILRDQNARLLGFRSHAEFKLQDRIATSLQSVQEMLQSLRKQVLPLGQKLIQQMKSIKRDHLAANHPLEDEEILPWDFAYYLRLLEESKKVDQEAISEFFPLQNTVQKMLGVFASFLQLRFQRLSGEELDGKLWHEDVEAWSVWDDKDEFVGHLYSDILYRDGKYKGNQNVNLQASYVAKDGRRVFPATILMCNFSPSAATGCALLRHSQVVTLFHELGHGIHDLLSRTLYTRHHAWRVPVEFGEALSTMLENWCWDKEMLQEISCHFATLKPEFAQKWRSQHPGHDIPNEKIPEVLLDPLLQNRNINRATMILRQTGDSLFDLAVHDPASHEELVEVNETQLFNSLLEELTLLRNPDQKTWGPGHCHYGHLMSGYDAGYYAYISARVFAADLYETAFASDPRSQDTWDRYRRVVLEAGGSRDESMVMREFLGHEPTPDALVRNLNLS